MHSVLLQNSQSEIQASVHSTFLLEERRIVINLLRRLLRGLFHKDEGYMPNRETEIPSSRGQGYVFNV